MLTAFLCSSVANDCRIIQKGMEFDDFYSCMKEGHKITYDILYNDKIKMEDINKLWIFPKWMCEETEKKMV